MVWKYLFIWVQHQPPSRDTGGAFFPKAITHVFVGMYIQEICLCALFFLARDAELKVAAVPQAALMIVLIVATVSAYSDPLIIGRLPLRLGRFLPTVDTLAAALACPSFLRHDQGAGP